MLTNCIKVLVLILGFSVQVGAVELFRFDRKVVGFQNHAKQGSVLFVSDDGRADWFQDGKLERKTEYQVRDKKCRMNSQDTSSMAEIGGMTLAYPFLVGLGRVCYLQESDHTVRLVWDFEARLIEGSFSATYAGENQEYSYFLINGRNIKSEEDGYLSLIRIHKLEKLATWTPDFITGLFGFSGAMVPDSNSVWVTTALAPEGGIFQILFEKLHAQAKATHPDKFCSLTTDKIFQIENGRLSIFMLSNQTSFLYYNGTDYPSFTVSKNTGKEQEKPFSNRCIPVSGLANQWLILCDGTVLETMD